MSDDGDKYDDPFDPRFQNKGWGPPKPKEELITKIIPPTKKKAAQPELNSVKEKEPPRERVGYGVVMIGVVLLFFGFPASANYLPGAGPLLIAGFAALLLGSLIVNADKL